jgi:hypothetical protein
MNCGECLMSKVQIVKLVNGVCPDCGTDYNETGEKGEHGNVNPTQRQGN